jgi:hypothetical protein
MPAPIQESSGKASVDGKLCSSTALWSARNTFGFGDSCPGVAKQLIPLSRRMDSVWQVFFMIFASIFLLNLIINLAMKEQTL